FRERHQKEDTKVSKVVKGARVLGNADEVLRAIFMPNQVRALAQMRADEEAGQEPRFAYYTTAETAAEILRSREVWMRMTCTMNDRSEVAHGMRCIDYGWEQPAGLRLKRSL